MDKRSFLIGLIGEGVGPSLSPELHEREAARHGLRYVYKTIDIAGQDIDAQGLAGLLDQARRLGFDGLNVTHPVKQLILPLLDELSPAAHAVGAVNTVTFDGGRMRGHNTDVTGFAASLAEGLGNARFRDVVLLGAGGAGSAVAHALAGRGVGTLIIIDAHTDRAERLAAAVRAAHGRNEEQSPGGTATQVRTVAPADLAEVLGSADGVVNATPSGMAAHPQPPFDPALLEPRLWIADIVYRPAETRLLAAARACGCRVLPGLGMAMHQAADAFEIFTGRHPDREAMAADLRELIAAETGVR